MGRVYGEKQRARSKKRGARYSYSGAMRREMSRRATAEGGRGGSASETSDRFRLAAACIAAESCAMQRGATRDEEKEEVEEEEEDANLQLSICYKVTTTNDLVTTVRRQQLNNRAY